MDKGHDSRRDTMDESLKQHLKWLRRCQSVAGVGNHSLIFKRQRGRNREILKTRCKDVEEIIGKGREIETKAKEAQRGTCGTEENLLSLQYWIWMTDTLK